MRLSLSTRDVALIAAHRARRISHRVRTLPPNVFAEFSALAAQHNAVNLGQGFPSFPTPDFVQQAAINAIIQDNNQYTRPGGHVQYVETLAEMYSPLIGRTLDPMREIATFNGAQEGLASILSALLEPGDEVLTLEPYFDAYVTVAQLHGVRAAGVPFRIYPDKKIDISSSRDFIVDLDKLETMITSKTKMLILNTPHNPTGKVLSRDELQQLAHVLERYPDIIVLADEVYEFMTYDGVTHERIAALPGFFDRTISLFSAGKTFSCTGWRVGYAVGPAHFIEGVIKAHSTVPFCGTTPFEVALASVFREAKLSGYFDELRETMETKRNRLCDALEAHNWRPIVPQGGYFVCCNVEGLPFYNEFRDIQVTADTPKTVRWSMLCLWRDCLALTREVFALWPMQEYPDYQFAYKLVKAGHLAVIPTSPFFSRPENRFAPGVVRLAFCKDDKTLDDSIRVIESLTN